MVKVIRERINRLGHEMKLICPPENRFVSKVFSTDDEVEEYRKKKQMMLQYKSDQRFFRDNPNATEDDLKDAPRIEFLMDTEKWDRP